MTMVYEMGDLLGETERFPDGPRATVVDVDLDRLRQERMRQGSFDDNRRAEGIEPGDESFRVIAFELEPPTGDIGLRRKVDRFPFVPDDEARLAQDCYEAYNIQVSGLEQRLRAIARPAAQDRHRRLAAASTPPTRSSSRPRRWTGSAARAPTSSASRCRASRRARAPRATPST